MAGFCNPMLGLWTPKFVKCEADSPKVSRPCREYSVLGRQAAETGFDQYW